LGKLGGYSGELMRGCHFALKKGEGDPLRASGRGPARKGEKKNFLTKAIAYRKFRKWRLEVTSRRRCGKRA